jgi:glycosyltransferase involved in cell wall biosynthesis
MSDGPLISVVVPSFNQGKYIEETILSVLNQSYSRFELIIIDGGSTDNTIDVIKNYADRVTYWISEKDKGQTDAIVKGLAKCTGELFNWINSDDKLAEGALQKIADAYIRNNKPDLIAGDIIMFDDKGKRKVHPRINHHGNLAMTLGFGQMCQPGMFYKTEVVRKTRINTSFHYSMDVELFFRFNLMSAAWRMVSCEGPLAEFRLHESSKTVMEGKTTAGSKFFSERTGLFSQYAKSFGDNNLQLKLRQVGFENNSQAEVLNVDKEKHQLFSDATNYFFAQQYIEAIHVWDKQTMKSLDRVINWARLHKELRQRIRKLKWKHYTFRFRIK